MTNTNSIKSTEIAGYIVRSAAHPKMILVESGEMLHEDYVGPGARCAKVYKTERGAVRSQGHRGITTHAINAAGIEISWLVEKGYANA